MQIETNCPYGIHLHPDDFQLFLLLFADDIVLLSSTIGGLQKQINELEKYCKETKLDVNMKKTKVITFKKGGKLSRHEKWFYRGNLIDSTSSYKYLGIYFTNHLTWSTHAEYASLQAQKVLIGILKNLKILGDLNLSSFFRIFDVKIAPILLHGSEIWGTHRFEQIAKVHLLACKKFLGVKMSTPNVMVYGECGRHPLFIDCQIKVIKYWLRLLTMPSYRLPRKCYEMMLLYDKNGHTNWATRVKELLFSTGFGNLWYEQNVDLPSIFISSFSQRLKDIYQQNWLEKLSLSTKCEYYLAVKTYINTEYYLSCVTVKKFRVSLARFRCSSHDLWIEKGRYFNIKREERLCRSCSNNAVENEYHFLFICPLYNDLRIKYLNEYYYVHPTLDKFSSLLQCNNVNTIQNLAMFIYYAMKLRKDKI